MTRDGGCDRFGIGWRPALAAGIFANLERIDVVEVLADAYFEAPRAAVCGLETLAAQVPVVLHGVGMGLAGAAPVAHRHLTPMARLAARLRPLFWSEHLAFVRAGGIEIGHLAAPPRRAAGVAAVARNVARAAAVVGAPPLLENVATLVRPPGSDLDEGAWLAAVLDATGGALLLDLHNLHANAVNGGFSARAVLDRLPIDRVRAIHLAGGRAIAGRVLDDHLHDVPAAVFDLLAEVGARGAGPLTVVLERDGRYPAMERLLADLDRARTALAAGRARRASEAAA
jgi:uncharacterized protein